MSATAPQQRRAGRAPYGQQREGEEDEREDLHAPADDHGELASPASSPAPGGSRTASSSNSPTRLAAGTPLSTAPASAAPSRAPPATPVTAQDLLDDPEARCWICYDGKEAVSESGERRMPLVHACSCSLVAHEDCLLAWIASYQTGNQRIDAGRRSEAPHCPVCNDLYVIAEPNFAVLKWVKRAEQKLDAASLYVFGAGVAGTVWVAACHYSLSAINAFAGTEVTQAIMDYSRHPWVLYSALPSIPAGLVLARTPLVDGILPLLPLTLVCTTTPTLGHFVQAWHANGESWRRAVRVLGIMTWERPQFPPSPVALFIIAPWVRHVYLKLKSRAYRALIGREPTVLDYVSLAELEEDLDRHEQEIGEQRRRQQQGQQQQQQQQGQAQGQQQRGPALVAEIEIREEIIMLDEQGRERHDEDEDDDEEEREDGDDGVVRAHIELHEQDLAQENAQPAAENNNNNNDGGGMGLPRRVMLSVGRITSFAVGALVFPFAAAWAGRALVACARMLSSSSSRPSLLAKFLGVSLASAQVTASASTSSSSSSVLAWLMRTSPSSSSRAKTASLTRGAGVEPVWWQSFVGGLAILLARDAAQLALGMLENRRLRARHVKRKDFRPNTASATGGSSSRRRATAQ